MAFQKRLFSLGGAFHVRQASDPADDVIAAPWGGSLAPRESANI